MISIAIDGPSGSGKSTLSKEVAQKLGFLHIDTGALYRAIAYYVFENQVQVDDVHEVLNNINIDLKFQNGQQKVILNGKDVSEKIRTPEISTLSSQVSKIKEVRDFLLKTQRDLAKENDVIMDGRDIGTAILPNATVKIFLTASSETRAKRRYLQLTQSGVKCDYSQILKGVVERDNQDMNREISPLKKADDAILLDTTNLNFDESIAQIIRIIKTHI